MNVLIVTGLVGFGGGSLNSFGTCPVRGDRARFCSLTRFAFMDVLAKAYLRRN